MDLYRIGELFSLVPLVFKLVAHGAVATGLGFPLKGTRNFQVPAADS